mmetsp:Transcript_86708/g.226301  ORF Transcript_86708/g.226301 Transcript_86708/m.226301 type:complete len:215 (+) Transcript_86708:526-1170(+)
MVPVQQKSSRDAELLAAISASVLSMLSLMICSSASLASTPSKSSGSSSACLSCTGPTRPSASPATHSMSASVEVLLLSWRPALVKIFSNASSVRDLCSPTIPSSAPVWAPNMTGSVLPSEISLQLSTLMIICASAASSIPLHKEIAGGSLGSISVTAKAHSKSGLARAANTYIVNSVAPSPLAEPTPSMSHSGPAQRELTLTSSPISLSMSSTV